MFYCVAYDRAGSARSFFTDTVRGAKHKASRGGFGWLYVKITDDHKRAYSKEPSAWRERELEAFWREVNGIREANGLRRVAV